MSKLKHEMWALGCVVGEMKLHSKSSERDRAEGEHEMKLHSKSSERDRAEGEHEDVKLYASGVRECA